MSVRIHLDRPHSCFTNLDFLTGRVILNLAGDAAISAITVKLEGDSKSRLSAPKQSYNNERSEKKRMELEWHKLLYRVETLFPGPDVQQQLGSANLVLLAGQYEYPFRFKFPFNNNCQQNSGSWDLKAAAMGISLQPNLNVRHVKQNLPPSLRFPGEAEIRYYVKATVVRPKFYQENIRSQVDIKFLPIEPPRLIKEVLEETFARRKQQFARVQPAPEPEKKGLFRKSSKGVSGPEEPPAFQVDARLPSPAIVTCNEPLPLRILVQKLTESNAVVFLSMLQIELIGYTYIRAHDLSRTETSSWVIMTQSNMKIPLGDSSDPVGKEWKVSSSFWDSIKLPNTVAPSFDTCNISRTYALEVRVGLSHGGTIDTIRPELMILPLRLAVKIYSGIAPPPALVQRLATSQLGIDGLATQAANAPSLSPNNMHGNLQPPSPLTPSYANQGPSPLGSTSNYLGSSRPPRPPGEEEEEAPPSYEDAMADEMAPVDGPRREYNVPAPPERNEGSGFGADSKTSGGGQGGGIGRRVSERLFPSTGRAQSHRRQGSGDAFDDDGTPARDGTTAPPGSNAQSLARRPTLPPSFEESTAGRERGDGNR